MAALKIYSAEFKASCGTVEQSFKNIFSRIQSQLRDSRTIPQARSS
jgi:hypothetical protein